MSPTGVRERAQVDRDETGRQNVRRVDVRGEILVHSIDPHPVSPHPVAIDQTTLVRPHRDAWPWAVTWPRAVLLAVGRGGAGSGHAPSATPEASHETTSASGAESGAPAAPASCECSMTAHIGHPHPQRCRCAPRPASLHQARSPRAWPPGRQQTTGHAVDFGGPHSGRAHLIGAAGQVLRRGHFPSGSSTTGTASKPAGSGASRKPVPA